MNEIVQTHRQNIKQLQIATRICWLTLRIYLLENVKIYIYRFSKIHKPTLSQTNLY